ncbi:MAG: Ribose operon repressor [bacterium ADurb.Bin429]|nr:MAG: Ribose operon repressor [bacterium ADurb.Bin429]
MAKVTGVPSTRRVTQRDIARHCGITQQAVSRALRGDTLISEETRARVQAAAEELGYDPSQSQAARRMALIRTGAQPRNNMVAISTSAELTNTLYFTELFRGVMHTLSANGVDLVVTLNSYPYSMPRPARRGELDGIICIERPEWYHEMMPHLRQLPTFGTRPIVSLIWPISGALSVIADDELGGYLAMRHLIELGHRHIMVLQNIMAPQDPETRRRAGIQCAIAEYPGQRPEIYGCAIGNEQWITPPPFKEPVTPENFPIIHGSNLLRFPLPDFLSVHPHITAIIGLNDASAIITDYLLEQAGYRVPRDISIIGFDDTDPLLDAEGRNVLTTVRVPLYSIGEEAARLLLRRMENEVADDAHTVLPPTLMVRGTTAPPKQ